MLECRGAKTEEEIIDRATGFDIVEYGFDSARSRRPDRVALRQSDPGQHHLRSD